MNPFKLRLFASFFVMCLFINLSLQHGEVIDDDDDDDDSEEELNDIHDKPRVLEDNLLEDIEPVQDNVLKPPPIVDNMVTASSVSLGPDQAPGEQGTPVVIENPTPEQKILIDRGYERNAYNEYASDMISVHRDLPDFRNDWCKKPGLHLPKAQLLPTSVIMCFHNEGWSVLLRSIHSILDRTPPHLLTEIVLVDDFSDHEHLKSKLEKYIESLKKVKLVRATKREGLIRARMLGASSAKGPILTFLDSHIEVTEGWAEPLVDRISRNWTTVVCPIIDVIDDDTLEFKLSERSITTVGGFTWDLIFTWKAASDEVLRSLKTPSDPVPSPTMAGGLFAIHKKFWERVGQYDKEFEIWGAENLEISFKTWMCGGRLEIVPCSHIGHLYRKRSPYSHKVGSEFKLTRNLVRLAAVWLDDYAKYYYAKLGNEIGDFGDISERVALRKKLKCKSFNWFIKNVYPDIFNPKKAVAEGEVRNQAFGGMLCLDARSEREAVMKPATIWPCHKQGGNQHWFYTRNGEMRRDELCLDFSGGAEIKMYDCHSMKGNQLWRYEDETGFLIHIPTQRCLTLDKRDEISIEECQERITQRWKFGKYKSKQAKKIHPEVLRNSTYTDEDVNRIINEQKLANPVQQ